MQQAVVGGMRRPCRVHSLHAQLRLRTGGGSAVARVPVSEALCCTPLHRQPGAAGLPAWSPHRRAATPARRQVV